MRPRRRRRSGWRREGFRYSAAGGSRNASSAAGGNATGKAMHQRKGPPRKERPFFIGLSWDVLALAAAEKDQGQAERAEGGGLRDGAVGAVEDRVTLGACLVHV